MRAAIEAQLRCAFVPTWFSPAASLPAVAVPSLRYTAWRPVSRAVSPDQLGPLRLAITRQADRRPPPLN
jgi:hypothetical protein